MNWAANSFMVADESVLIKNRNSLNFKGALRLVRQSSYCRALTGLPAPQAPYDLWAQLRFCGFLDGRPFHAFKHKYCVMGGFKGKQFLMPRNTQKLEEELKGMCFRARRKAWGMKLPTDYEIVRLSMTQEQQISYAEMEQDFITWLQSGAEISVEQAISKYIKMQQISSGIVLDEHGNAHSVCPFEHTPKFKHLYHRLNDEVDGKTLVVANYTNTIRQLQKFLHKHQPAVISAGSNVDYEKKRFNEDPDCRVMIGQSQAIKYGHNLMGSETDPCLSMCFYENNYSLDNRAQAEERPQGAGQQGNLHIWDYASSGIEVKILTALQRKKDVAKAIMEGYQEIST